MEKFLPLDLTGVKNWGIHMRCAMWHAIFPRGDSSHVLLQVQGIDLFPIDVTQSTSWLSLQTLGILAHRTSYDGWGVECPPETQGI